MGYITPEVAGKFPGFLDPNAGLKFTDIPNGLAAISKVPSLGSVLRSLKDQAVAVLSSRCS